MRHDAVALIELDRVLDASPDELDKHRIGLRAARQDRLKLISDRTTYLLDRMNGAVSMANSKVLFNPKQSPAVVRSSNTVVAEVRGFQSLLGIEAGRESAAHAKRWRQAASQRLQDARAAGAQSVDGLKRFGAEAREHAGDVKETLDDKIAELKRGRREHDE